MHILEKILEYIFLPTCGICGNLGEGYLCKRCGKEIEKYVIFENKILNSSNNIGNEFENKVSNIEKMHIFKYEDIIRNLILKYKFNDKSYLYKTFCEFIVKNKKVFDFIKSYDIIIPVPIHKARMRERGYNQSELIAKELAKKLGLKLYTDVLIKMKNNKIQSTLSGTERVLNTKKIYSKKILIFDDVYTTGATVNSCIGELKRADVKKIGILTLAKD